MSAEGIFTTHAYDHHDSTAFSRVPLLTTAGAGGPRALRGFRGRVSGLGETLPRRAGAAGGASFPAPSPLSRGARSMLRQCRV